MILGRLSVTTTQALPQFNCQSACNVDDGYVRAGGELAAMDRAAPGQPSRRINLCTAINDALHIALAADPKCVLLSCNAVTLHRFLSPTVTQRLSVSTS